MDIEPESSWKVYIDSNHRVSGTDANFTFNINPPPGVKFNRVVVLDALIKKSYYLVNSDGNTFILRENGVDTTVTIPVGNYNFNSFQFRIGALLTAASPNLWTYACTYPNTTQNADTGKWVFTVTGNSSQPAIVFPNSSTNFLYEAFGFDEGSTNTFTANTLMSTDVADLNIEDSLYIKSNIVSAGPNQQGILQTIKVAPSPVFSSITYLCPAPAFYSQPVLTNLTNTISISIVDEHDHVINLNGQNTTMTLLFYRENTVWSKLKAFMKYLIIKLGISTGEDL